MTEATLNILMSAVTVAKDEQIRTVQALKKRMAQLFPGQDAEIDEAINAWASHARRTA